MRKLVVISVMATLMTVFIIMNPPSAFAEIKNIDENQALETNVSVDGINDIEENDHVKIETVEELEITNNEALADTTEEQGANAENANFTVKAIDDTIDITVEKVWIGKKLNEVTIKLLADKKVMQSVKLSDVNGWKFTFTKLTKYRPDGKEIEYTIEEEMKEGYETSVEGNRNVRFQVRNKEIAPPAKVEEASPVQVLQNIEQTENVAPIETKTVEAEPTVEKVAGLPEKVSNTSTEKPIVLATTKTIEEGKTQVDDAQVINLNTLERIPQLGWGKESSLFMFGIGFVVLALILFIKRIYHKVN